MKSVEQLMDREPEEPKRHESTEVKLNLLEKILFRFPPTRHYLCGRQRKLAEKVVEAWVNNFFKKP